MPANWMEFLSGVGGILLGGGLGSIIVALIALYKARSERHKTTADAEFVEAETAEKYLVIADRAAERALKLDKRICQLEKTVEQQQQTIETLLCENISLRSDHEKLADEFDRVLNGAHVLRDQVVKLNEIPKYEPPERRRKPR